MTIRADRITTKSRRAHRCKSQVKLRDYRVAAVAQFTDLLECQQMPIRTAMRVMTGSAAFDARCGMLEYKWTVLRRMAVRARLIPGPAQAVLHARSMWIVAGDAGQYILPQTVAFTEIECGEDVFVAFGAGLRTAA